MDTWKILPGSTNTALLVEFTISGVPYQRYISVSEIRLDKQANAVADITARGVALRNELNARKALHSIVQSAIDAGTTVSF